SYLLNHTATPDISTRSYTTLFRSWSVSVSTDGNTALVGAYWDDIDGNQDQGSAYIYVRSGTTWTQQTKLLASDGANSDDFGWSRSEELTSELQSRENLVCRLLLAK